jgi:outer membrane receptor for ferrienterochelin and colicin
MKKFYLLFLSLFLLLSLQSFAKNDKGNTKITGTVIDSVTQKPVEFANVALTKADSNTPVDGSVCNDKGEFTISKVAPGNYKLVISFIGFESRTIAVNVEDKKDVDVGKIIIAPTQQILKEVTVEGQKALIEERVDRTVYNAENDATAKGGDATDVLKRVPMLSVDLDGNVSLRGNSNIMVLINNKPSTIVASSVADALKQIPADQIKTVEVITSPSAKYDAEGSAGIINIITKKNSLEGLTLNVDAGVGLRGSNLGLNGNYRKGKMGFSLGGFGRANYNIRGRFRNEQITGSTTNTQTADTRNEGLFGHYNLGWDYDIDKKNALAASVRFGLRNQRSWQDDLTTQSFEDDVLQRTTIADNRTKDLSNNVDANFTYTHYYDKPQRELSIQGLFSRNNRDNNFENIYSYADMADVIDRLNKNNSFNQEVTVQVDYQTPIVDNQMIEFGAKNISRKVFSDFETYQATGENGSYVLSPGAQFNNNLNYDQNVMAGYLSYTYTAKSGYSFKAGTRYEYTNINAYSETDDDIEIPSYDVIVPSINASKRLKNGNTLKASYNRRIQRPSIRFLNPNVQWQNNLNVTQGDPNLTPEYTNNYELGYSTILKGVMLNLTGFVRNTTDAIQPVREVVEIDGNMVNQTTYKNIGEENAYGSSIFANINIGKLSLNGGGDVFYAMLDNNIGDPEFRASNEGWAFSGRMFGNYNMSKGWGFQFFSFYRGNQVQLQGKQGGFYMYSVAIRKEFNEKRGSIGLGVENFLQKSIKIKTTVETPTIVQTSVNEMFNSSIRLNFSYRIGKMSMDNQPRRRKTINNDDLKDGSGDNMQMGDGAQQPQRGGMNMGTGNGQRTQNQKPQTPAQIKSDSTSADTVAYDATGIWNYSIDSPQGGQGTIVIRKENDQYSGTIKNGRMPQETPVNNLQVNGNNVSFSYPVNFNGQQATIDVAYKITDKAIAGTLSMGQVRTFNLTGTKSE